jgi:hypothetical protein
MALRYFQWARDDSIQNSLSIPAQKDPQSAIGLASGIADADLRSKSQRKVVMSWIYYSRPDAEQMIKSSPLPKDEKERLLIANA